MLSVSGWLQSVMHGPVLGSLVITGAPGARLGLLIVGGLLSFLVARGVVLLLLAGYGFAFWLSPAYRLVLAGVGSWLEELLAVSVRVCGSLWTSWRRSVGRLVTMPWRGVPHGRMWLPGWLS